MGRYQSARSRAKMFAESWDLRPELQSQIRYLMEDYAATQMRHLREACAQAAENAATRGGAFGRAKEIAIAVLATPFPSEDS